MRAQLVPLDGGDPVEITKDLVVVGRKEECDLRLEHKSVSKIHCVLVKTDGLLLLRDLGSTNGTRVNGTRVRRAALLPNDQLAIAGYKFRIHLGPDDSPRPVRGAMEHTQHIEVEDADFLRAPNGRQARKGGDREPRHSAKSVQRNELPDVYDDDSSAEPSGP
jgi:pSer/pThr/pTyr-binding forkhead associated (FHA) protein